MDQIKIGNFIKECRKKSNMTQNDLAEKIGVTDKAISKWENGRGLPDTSVMLDLCKELNISVNELLSGELIESENYTEKAENNLLDLNRKNEKKRNTIIFFIVVMIILLIISVAELFFVLLQLKKSQLDTLLTQAENSYNLHSMASDLYDKVNNLEKRVTELENNR